MGFRPFLALISLVIVGLVEAEDLSDSITFYIYPETGESTSVSGASKQTLTELGCSKNKKFSLIVHGWLEDCNREWIVELRSNLLSTRGGCIICMDYSTHSKNFNYFGLVGRFNDIKSVLTTRLRLMDDEGFNFDRGFIFGFSFGGHLSLESAIELGEKRFRMIDICEKAGPGFSEYQMKDPKLAAKNVQCIHTSLDKGMQARNCHQNWSMGNCGLSQDAAGFYPKGAHGLCPYFYNSAFKNPFYAVAKPVYCQSSREVKKWPHGYSMGYMEDRSSDVQGEFFAKTSRELPYNVIPEGSRLEHVEVTTTLEDTTATESEFTTINDSTDRIENTKLSDSADTTWLDEKYTTTGQPEEQWLNEIWQDYVHNKSKKISF